MSCVKCSAVPQIRSSLKPGFIFISKPETTRSNLATEQKCRGSTRAPEKHSQPDDC